MVPRHALIQTTTAGFHINSSHCCEWVHNRLRGGGGRTTWIQPERWWKETTAAGQQRASQQLLQCGNYLGGCGGGQLLHCRGSESDGAASWCRWVWTTGLPPAQRRRRWWRAGASGTGSPARQPLNGARGKREEACFFLGCLGVPEVENRDKKKNLFSLK